ncbi:hypothetical protein HYD66_02835 [Mycoplasmopsis bovis]|nr:hypothetical protein [Mycoplasmopsis bovis]QQH55119.1 hypothetical protein HYD66_02835 [Mycoplasmopsis bovis]
MLTINSLLTKKQRIQNLKDSNFYTKLSKPFNISLEILIAKYLDGGIKLN